MTKLGIMGGTFNPIHEGHIMIARAAMADAQLHEVLFLPSGQPPHKSDEALATAISRLNMTILAVYGKKGFSVSDIEVMREGVTYTVDTLRELRQLRPADRLYYIIGGDTLLQMHAWRDPEEVFSLLDGIVVFARPDVDRVRLHEEAEKLSSRFGRKIVLTKECGPDISATMIRTRCAAGESLGESTPLAVQEYISAHGLYHAPYNQMVMELERTLSEYRLRHTLSVAETAVWLANRFGVNPIKAHLAGLLHDCAKGMDAPVLLQLIKSGGISADDMELSIPALLHAPAGAALARSQYHITDAAVLSAIRWHTTGRRNMTDLEKVVYLADMIEPERESYPGLDDLRKQAYVDLDKAVHMAAALSASYVAGRGKKLHPRTLELAREAQNMLEMNQTGKN